MSTQQQTPVFNIVTGAAAQANVVGLPANVLLYGPGGMGKTTDAVAAFCKDGRCNAFVIPCEDGGLKGPAARGLPVPDHVEQTVKSWDQMKYTIAWLSQYRQNYSAVIIDGLSTLTNYMYREATETLKGPKSNKWDIPVFVRNNLFYLREWIRALGLHSVFVGHQLQPAVVEGVFHPGSPLMQPKTMIGDYVGLLDTVLRVDYVLPATANPLVPATPERVYFTGGTAWPEGFQQPGDWRMWRTKNREGCNSAIVPADLGMFLRARKPPYPGL